MGFKLKAAFETTIAVTTEGYIEISQPDTYGERDSIIHLSRDQIQPVIDELIRLKDDDESWPDDSLS